MWIPLKNRHTEVFGSTGFGNNGFSEVFGSTGFGNNGFSGVTDILAIPKLKFYIKNVQSNGFSGVTDKMASPN